MEIERIDIKKLSRSACSRVLCGKCGNVFNAYRKYLWVRKSDQERICYDCAEKVYNVRKEKLEWHLPRKDLKKESNLHTTLTECGICERTFWTKANKYHWHLVVKDPPKHLQVAGQTEYEYDVCYECAEAKVIYRQQYGFWLRGFVSEHFVPCEKCQDKLHEMMMTMTVAFHTQNCITIETVKTKGEIVWQFLLRFLTYGSTLGLTSSLPSSKEVFQPCEECQKKLQYLWETKELHIGNENKPPVELWRKMSQVIQKADKYNRNT